MGVYLEPAFLCSFASNHSTLVAATILSIAPGASLWAAGSCIGSPIESATLSELFAQWGADVFNLSFGANTNLVPGPMDRFYDELVFHRRRTVVAAAGNHGVNGLYGPFPPPAGNVLSPGLAYNVITVGNFDDKGTVEWDDDVIAISSSANNPDSVHDDREKPEIVAPGTNITGSLTNWTHTDSGTSFAAPIVAGAAAQLMQRNNTLAFWPEALKATLLASAINNVDGAPRLSPTDGAGGLAINRADNVLAGTSGGVGARNYGCSENQFVDLATMQLAANMWTRVVIAWSTPIHLLYDFRPLADLDLQVVGPGGSVVSTSAKQDNTFEIVRFLPASSGSYKLRVRKTRCNDNNVSFGLGWAWHKD